MQVCGQSALLWSPALLTLQVEAWLPQRPSIDGSSCVQMGLGQAG